MFTVLILLLLAPSVGPLNDLMEVYATPSKGRGRLVVACDMRSDTCSDGRRITTVRATPVPCETSPGVWEMVPEDTGCYSVRGLESWRENTSYLAYGTELDRSPWQAVDCATVQSLPTGGYRVTGIDGVSRIYQLIPPDAGTWTFACYADTGSSTGARLRVYYPGGTDSLFCNLDSVPGFQTHSCTYTFTNTPTYLSVAIYPGSSGHIDIAGCWLTKSDTPGRACWGGEAPVTCGGDRHTISTEGWPTEAGEISVTFSVPPAGVSGSSRLILDSRLAAVGTYFRISSINNLQAYISGIGLVTITPVEPREDPYVLRVVVSDGTIRFYLDGVERNSREGALVWAETASLGSTGSRTEQLNGPIRSLRVRRFE